MAAVEAAISSYSLILKPPLKRKTLFSNGAVARRSKSTARVHLIRHRRRSARIAAVNEVSAAAVSRQVEVTWQIIVGAIAGVTPFVVAGIEFSKRIMAQRRCEECGGSGLVLRENEYFRCPACGGFLPWQSWKRFFSG